VNDPSNGTAGSNDFDLALRLAAQYALTLSDTARRAAADIVRPRRTVRLTVASASPVARPIGASACSAKLGKSFTSRDLRFEFLVLDFRALGG
jgi:hypothetical protein